MRKLLALVFLLTLITPTVHAGFFEDVFDALGGVAQGISETVFGVARIDSESVCVEKTIEYFQPELTSNENINDQLAFGAYNYFTECKSKAKNYEKYEVNCAKKQRLESFCNIIKSKCENADFASSDLKTAKSFGSCATAEKMCKDALKKNYASCGKKIRN